MFLERNEILPCFVIYDISIYFMCELDQTAGWEYEEEKVTGAYPQQTKQNKQPKRTIQRTNKPNLVDQFQSNCWEIYEVHQVIMFTPPRLDALDSASLSMHPQNKTVMYTIV